MKIFPHLRALCSYCPSRPCFLSFSSRSAEQRRSAPTMEYLLESRLWESARHMWRLLHTTGMLELWDKNLHRSTGAGSQSSVCYTQLWAANCSFLKMNFPFLVVFCRAPSAADPALSLLSPSAATLKQRGYPSCFHGFQECREKKNGKIKGRIFVLFGESS